MKNNKNNNVILKHSKDTKRELFKMHDRFPNTNGNWHIADTEELFNSNFKKYSDSIHLKNYLNNPIKYNYNNFAFRTFDDFNLEDDGNVFLGCSHTFGIGHHLENTWSYKLHKKVGGKFYNISEPGSGISTQYEYLNYFKNKIKFKNVFHYLPDECWVRFFGHILKSFTTEEELKNIVFMYINLISDLCKSLDVNYYLLTKSYLSVVDSKFNIDPYHISMTPARDLMHYYVEEHDNIVDIFYEKYSKKAIHEPIPFKLIEKTIKII
jgi:hypothetical protein